MDARSSEQGREIIMKTAIEIHKIEDVKLSITEHAHLAKKDALEAAALIKTVSSDMTQQAAADANVSIKKVLKVVESSRKEIKAPVIAMGKEIDRMAEEFSEDLELESRRLERMIAPYEEGKRKAAAEAEAKRQAEIRKLEEENRKAQEEAARKIREAQEAAAKSANEADKKRADELAAKMKAEADKKDAEYEEALRAKPIQATKTEGLVGKEVIKFEVLDIVALSRSHPHLVRMEVNVSAMNIFLKSEQPIPVSIRTWKEFDVNART